MFEVMTADNGLNPYVLQTGKVYRKEIIKYGTFRHPNPFLTDDPEFNFDFNHSEATQMIANFNAGLVPSVKLLQIHDEELGKIVGVVQSLEATARGIDAIIDVEDDEVILSLEKRDSSGKRIGPDVSVGMDMNFPISEPGQGPARATGVVLRHVALATIPWISGMEDWETVEARLAASGSTYNFGHEGYTGTPLVPEEGVRGVDKKTLRRALKILASNAGKTEEEMAKVVGIDLTDEDPSDKLTPALAAILASLVTTKPDDEDDKPKPPTQIDIQAEAQKVVDAALAPVLKGIGDLATVMASATGRVEATEAVLQARAAEEAVGGLIKAGKVLPIEKPQYTALFMSNAEMFETIAATLPVKVVFNEETGSGQDPQSGTMNLSKEQVDENIERLAGLITATNAGKADKISGGK